MTTTQRRVLAATLAVLIPIVASAQAVRNREARQQQRIGHGLASGQITARGAVGLENRESRINASRRADLAANGGHLTPGQSRNLNRRENLASSHIYIDRHHDVAQPGLSPCWRSLRGPVVVVPPVVVPLLRVVYAAPRLPARPVARPADLIA